MPKMTDASSILASPTTSLRPLANWSYQNKSLAPSSKPLLAIALSSAREVGFTLLSRLLSGTLLPALFTTLRGVGAPGICDNCLEVGLPSVLSSNACNSASTSPIGSIGSGPAGSGTRMGLFE